MVTLAASILNNIEQLNRTFQLFGFPDMFSGNSGM